MVASRTALEGWERAQLNSTEVIDLTPAYFQWGAVSGTGFSRETTLQRSGVACLKVVAPSGSASEMSAGTWTGKYVAMWVKFTVLPSFGARPWFGVNDSSGNAFMKIKSDGAIEVWDGLGNTNKLTTTTTLNTTDWHKIEWLYNAGAWTMWIDGTQEANALALGTTDIKGAFGASGDTTGNTYTLYVDDIVIANGRVTENSKIIIMKPTSDNQRGTFTGGAGGTTNLFEALNNDNPIGTATETDLTQIESADSSPDNSTDEYRAEFSTYAAAGATGTIVSVQAVVSDGEDVATGVKTGSFSVLSNPASGSYFLFTAGSDVGALGSWPTNWRQHRGTIVLGGGVADTASPIVAIRKTDTGTRVMSVCYLGLIVEYEPAAAPPADAPQMNSFFFAA